MYKIAISGKANSGKDTIAKLFLEVYNILYGKLPNFEFTSFADPIKEMAMLMFPRTKRKTLYGPSENRNKIIPGAFKDGYPLTYRRLLQDLGTEIGRAYKEDIWLDALDYKLEKAQKHNRDFFITQDVRFINEIKYLKDRNYILIRLKRNSSIIQSISNHASETEQDSISDNEFNFIIDNNGTIEDLKEKVINILKTI
jgi:dephospho-CoA kinase